MKLVIGLGVVMGICTIMDLINQKIWMPLVMMMFPYIGICLWMDGRNILLHLAGGILAAGVFGIMSVMTKGQIGMADVIVIGMIVMALGMEKGILVIIGSLFYAFLAAVLFVVFLKKGGKTRMPFVPFLFGSFLTVVIG